MPLCSGTSVVISVGAITMNRQPRLTIAPRMSSRSRSIWPMRGAPPATPRRRLSPTRGSTAPCNRRASCRNRGRGWAFADRFRDPGHLSGRPRVARQEQTERQQSRASYHNWLPFFLIEYRDYVPRQGLAVRTALAAREGIEIIGVGSSLIKMNRRRLSEASTPPSGSNPRP